MWFSRSLPAAVVIWLLTASCKAARREELQDPDLFRTSYMGYTAEGEPHLCYPDVAEMATCPRPSENTLRFVAACSHQGYRYFRCACELFLCSHAVEP